MTDEQDKKLSRPKHSDFFYVSLDVNGVEANEKLENMITIVKRHARDLAEDAQHLLHVINSANKYILSGDDDITTKAHLEAEINASVTNVYTEMCSITNTCDFFLARFYHYFLKCDNSRIIRVDGWKSFEKDEDNND